MTGRAALARQIVLCVMGDSDGNRRGGEGFVLDCLRGAGLELPLVFVILHPVDVVGAQFGPVEAAWELSHQAHGCVGVVCLDHLLDERGQDAVLFLQQLLDPVLDLPGLGELGVEDRFCGESFYCLVVRVQSVLPWGWGGTWGRHHSPIVL